jgi:hypothetical protein
VKTSLWPVPLYLGENMNHKEIEELAGHRLVSAWVVKLVGDAVAIEREACADIAENWRCNGMPRTVLADQIRARGQK